MFFTLTSNHAECRLAKAQRRACLSVPCTQLYGLTAFVAVADADVISALIFVGILVPASTAAASNGVAGTSEAAEVGAPSTAVATAAAVAAMAVFKPLDTAALRAVAVQVR